MMSPPLSRFAMVMLFTAPVATAAGVVLKRTQVTCQRGAPCRAEVQLHLVVGCPAGRAADARWCGELQELLGRIADTVFARDPCAPERASSAPVEDIVQQDFLQRDVRVCAAGPFTFIRLRRRYPACAVSSARLHRGDRQVEVLLLKPAEACSPGTCQYLVVYSPVERSTRFEMELLSGDGAICERYAGLTLKGVEAR